MTDKTKSKTYNFLLENKSIEDILNQSNAIFKNNKGEFKERHNGLTIKFSNNTNEEPSWIIVNNELSENEIFSDALDDLNNTPTNEISQTQIDFIDEKITDKLAKYSYNVLTILEDKKIKLIRKEIFNLKQALNNFKINNKELSKEIEQNNSNLKIKYKELSNLKTELIKIELEIKNKINFDNNLSSKEYLLNNNIKNIENEIFSIGKNNKEIVKKNEINNNEINKFESNIHQLNQKLDKYINELSIPATVPAFWIKKSDEVAELHKKIQNVTTNKEFYKIRKKIDKIDNKMIKIWDSKKVEQIYEEILPIEDKIFFITTFIYANQSISEEIIFFHDFGNNNFQIVKQTKHYHHIEEYTKNLLLIDKENKEVVFEFTPIKDLLKKHNDLKLKPTKTEISIWNASWLIPTTLIVIGLIHPPLFIVGVGLGIVGLTLKGIASFLDPWTKKVESRIRQNFSSLIRKISFFNRKLTKTKEELEIKDNLEKTISNLTNDKGTKLQIQYDILKQELDNRKDKEPDNLIINNTINHKSNSILKNSNIKSLNMNNFDSSIRNTVNHQEQQPSTSKKTNNLNLT